MVEKHYCSFIKVGDRMYMESLLNEGAIYCRPIDYFTQIDCKDLRGDKHDGVAIIEQVRDIQLIHEGKVFAKAVAGQYYGRDVNNKGNIYCLYGIDTSTLNMEIGSIRPLNLDVSSLSFGDTAVLIYDTGEFIRRVEETVKKEGYKIDSSPVTSRLRIVSRRGLCATRIYYSLSILQQRRCPPPQSPLPRDICGDDRDCFIYRKTLCVNRNNIQDYNLSRNSREIT